MNRSFILIAILAGLFGLVAAFGTLILRWQHVAGALKQSNVVPELAPRDWDFWTSETGTLSEELRKERLAVAERAKDLDAWQKQIEAEKAELVSVREQIQAIRDEIDKTAITLLEAEKPNLKSLSRSYASMKAPQAAAIFKKTNDDIVVKILSLMKPETTAKILAEMSLESTLPGAPPDEISGAARAARITEMLRLLKQENIKKDNP